MSSPTSTDRQAQADAAARDVVLLFRRIRQAMQSVPAGDLPAGQAAVLLRLERDGASSTTRLAAAEGVRSQSMTATLNALDARGLIERRADPDDGRRFIVTLSEAGREEVSSGRQARHRWLALRLAARLSSQELEAVSDSIALVNEALDEPSPDPATS